jgi:excinuclease ABC subunit A
MQPPGESSYHCVSLRGARVHNLQNLDLDIPRDRFVVLTGPSGSGKSSLAFDTLYAEGQRQYIETLSVYARQFLHQLQRPDVDLLEGLPPTVCIDQRPGSQGRRSTVATATEIYEYLRLLMARLGRVFCHQCGLQVTRQSPEQIQQRIVDLPQGTKVMILAPLVRGRRGAHKEVLSRIRKAGFVRARIDGNVYDVESLPVLSPRRNHHVEAVVDRVVVRPDVQTRVGDSVRLAIEYGRGRAQICYLPPANGDDGPAVQPWHEELFSTEHACPGCNISYEEIEPRTFSFSSPYGACLTCDGLGAVEGFDAELVVPDRSLSLAAGAVAPWRNLSARALEKQLAALAPFLSARGGDANLPLDRWPQADQEQLLFGNDQGFLGVLRLLEKEYATTTRKTRLALLASYRASLPCPACAGSRLRPEARSVRLGGRAIHEITALSAGEAHQFLAQLPFDAEQQKVAEPLVGEIVRRLDFLQRVGVDYLTLDRATDTLSGGELQRVRLATGIGSGLVGVCYILDEPSVGLHQRDNQRLIKALRDLQQAGNTVIVVEHDEAMMRQADHIIDMGPRAGAEGGRVVAEGPPAAVRDHADSITGRYLSGAARIPVPPRRRRVAKTRSLTLGGATINNLKQVDVRIPLGAFVCVTGVSGSGKSSLINETFAPAIIRRLGGLAPKPGQHGSLRGVAQVDKVIPIDQSPIGRTPRSNPATFTGVFDEIRKIFAGTREARQRGFGAGRFSFNVKGGRCEACQGQGVQKIEMSFLPDMYVTCDECEGTRFNRQTLRVHYRGHSIADVLAMSINEAADFFANFAASERILSSLRRVGLGYLPLGQPSTTLSGGEAQRVKLATELARVDTGQTLYLLDEPTTGLHFDDIRRLLDVLQRLVDKGNTVVVIEHNLEVIKCADWIIDMGPEGGAAGGRIVAAGTPEEVAACPDSHTARFLAEMLA